MIVFKKKITFLNLIICQFIFSSAYSQIQTNTAESYFNSLYKFMYTNQDSTQLYKQKLLDLSVNQNNVEQLIYTYIVSNKSTLIFNNMDELENNLKKLDSLFPVAEKEIEVFNDFHEVKNSYFHDKAVFNIKTYNYKKAKINLDKIFKYAKKTPDSLLTDSHRGLIDVSYKVMAKMYSNNKEYELAIQYLDKSIRFINSKNTDHKEYLINGVNRQKGDIYKKLKDYKKATYFTTKALNYTLKHNKSNTNQLINEVYNTVDNYLALKQYDSASYYLEQIKPLADTNIPYGFLYYKSRAKLNEALNNTESIQEDYDKALELLNRKWNGLKQVEIAETLQSYSNFLISNNQYNQALKQNAAAITHVSGKDVVNSSINQITLFKLLQQKALIAMRQNQSDSVIKNTYQATRLLDTLKPHFKNKTDKLLLIENAYSVFENGLQATYNNYKSNKKNAVNDAFFFLEKSKSTLLLEALLSVKAEKFGAIPNEIIIKEDIYKNTITNLEKQLNQKQNDVFKDQLFDVKSNYRTFLDTLENNYKDYYNLKYNAEVTTIKTVQKELKPSTAMLSFFYGNDAIYGVILDQDNTYFEKIELNQALEKQLKLFQKQISTPKTDILSLKNNAAKLYTILLAPFLDKVNQPNLIILTDGLLNYIPFESLVKDNHYLVENYAVSYINSATLLKELENKKSRKNNLLAFAPEFEGDIYNSVRSKSLQPLPHSKVEIQNINQYYKGNLLINKDASLENFKTNASDYGIIHLATHAIFNDTNPEYSYLAFGNEASDLLYTADLYNLNLNANLVTLSACESGIGNLKRGEGLLSLARGFYFSGAQSISSTLWKINDASSATLMSDFYKNLSKGQSKDLALQQAKLNFIKQNKDNALSHPYYWSAFIISGNTEPLTSTHYWLWVLAGILLLVTLSILLKKYKN